MQKIIALNKIKDIIFFIRGQSVMIDRDLANLYEVSTKRLNEQVKRNNDRFPKDFCFQLNLAEYNELVANCDRLTLLKHSSSLPYVFTEQGVAMLSSVLRSKKAIQVNIVIMRVFVKMKEFSFSYKILEGKLSKLEKQFGNHDNEIKQIFKALNYLIKGESEKQKKKEIGFKV